MANTIKLKRGTSTPSTSDIASGEVAIDTSAQKLYINDSGTVKEIGGGGSSIGGNTGVDFNDDVKVRWGTGNDLEIYHGSNNNSYIKEGGSGNLYIFSENLRIENADGSESYIEANNGGAVELYFNGSKKLESSSTGVTVTGGVTASGASTFGSQVTINGELYLEDNYKINLGNSADLKLYHDGTYSYLKNTPAGGLYLASPLTAITNLAVTENIARFNADGDVELYYDASKKFETTSSGGTLTGYLSFPDNGGIKCGASADLHVYHDGNNSYISELGTGDLILNSNGNNIFLKPTGNETGVKIIADGAVELYYDNSLKLESTSYGVFVTGTFRADVIDMQDNKKSNWGNNDDLEIYHDGTDSIIKAAGSATPIKIQGHSSNTSTVHISARADKETIKCLNNSNAPYVELYYNNSKKLETTSTGVTVTGNVNLAADNNSFTVGAGQDLQIYHDGTNNILRNVGTRLDVIVNSSETAAVFNPNTSVDLYYDNSKKLETTSSGVTVTGTGYVSGGWRPLTDNAVSLGSSSYRWYDLNISNDINISDNGKVILGDGDDLQIYHDGSAGKSVIYHSHASGVLSIAADHLNLADYGNEHPFITCDRDGAVELYYDNSKKLETYSSGVEVIGNLWLRTAGGKIQLNDNIKLHCGNGDDLQIYHDGSNSYLKNTTGRLDVSSTSYLYLESNDRVYIGNVGMSEVSAIFIKDGAVQLQYDNVLRFGTNSDGAQVFGNLYHNDNSNSYYGSSQDLRIYHDGSNSYIKDAGTGQLDISSDKVWISGSNNESMADFTENGAVQLYYDNSKKLDTYSSGVIVHGELHVASHLVMEDNDIIKLGSSADLQITHDGTDSTVYNNTGNLLIYCANDFYLKHGTEVMIAATDDAHVSLYYDGSQKFYTQSDKVVVAGHCYPEANNSYDLGHTSYRWNNVWGANTSKAYINLNQTNNNIRLAYNVASITDNGTGQHRITFTTALSNAYYSVTTGGSRDQPESSRCFPTNVDNINTTYFDITNHNDGSTNVDWALCCCIVHGL